MTSTRQKWRESKPSHFDAAVGMTRALLARSRFMRDPRAFSPTGKNRPWRATGLPREQAKGLSHCRKHLGPDSVPHTGKLHQFTWDSVLFEPLISASCALNLDGL